MWSGPLIHRQHPGCCVCCVTINVSNWTMSHGRVCGASCKRMDKCQMDFGRSVALRVMMSTVIKGKVGLGGNSETELADRGRMIFKCETIKWIWSLKSEWRTLQECWTGLVSTCSALCQKVCWVLNFHGLPGHDWPWPRSNSKAPVNDWLTKKMYKKCRRQKVKLIYELMKQHSQ